MNEYNPEKMVRSNVYEEKNSRSSVNRTFSQDSSKYGYFTNQGSNIIRAIPGKEQDHVYERQ